MTNAKCVLGVWLCKLIVLHLPPFIIFLCGGIDGEGCNQYYDKQFSAIMKFEVVQALWKTMSFLYFALHHVTIKQKDDNSITLEQGNNVNLWVLQINLCKNQLFL